MLRQSQNVQKLTALAFCSRSRNLSPHSQVLGQDALSTTQGPVPGVLCSHRKGLYPHVQLGFSLVAVVPSLSCCFGLPRRACLCRLCHLSFGMCRMQLEPHFSIPHLILHIFNLLSLQFIRFPYPCVCVVADLLRVLLKALLIRLMVPSQLLHRPQGPCRLPHLVFCPSQCLWRDIRIPGFCPRKGKESLSSVCDAFPDSWKS